ncbi:glutathione peroxidase [Oscillatoriales cyanobacterium USR001]|nr:glutathione peroxidase [Oscillatoriales cyanobacterium USR001]
MTSSIFDIKVKTITGEEKQLAEYAGNVLLIVNLASKCGYTPQYAGLEKLNQKYQGMGLRILGFPCNDYGEQEPGTNEEIVEFCTTNYGVTFDLFDKIHAKGPEQHPLYTHLIEGIKPKDEVAWNFEKFLVSKQGEVVARFRTSVSPESIELGAIIEVELDK